MSELTLDELVRTHARVVETTGWTAFILGGILTGMAITLTAPAEAPECHEDEVAVAALPGDDYVGGMRAEHCIPLDDLVCGPSARLTVKGCER